MTARPIRPVDLPNPVGDDDHVDVRLVLQGPGAGPDAAASAVLADLVRAAKDAPASAGTLLASLVDQPAATVAPLGLKNPYPAAS